MRDGTTSRAWWLVIGAALLVIACGDDDAAAPGLDGGSATPDADASSPPADAAVGDAASQLDAAAPDAGPVSCVAEAADATSTVGCNGGFQGEPGANEPGGRCELGTDARPAGSCTTERAICMGDLAGSEQGWCVIGCAPPESLVDAQTCPTGYRCFRHRSGRNAYGLCYRDCDDDHPCQDGWTCNDSFGRCEETPPA